MPLLERAAASWSIPVAVWERQYPHRHKAFKHLLPSSRAHKQCQTISLRNHKNYILYPAHNYTCDSPILHCTQQYAYYIYVCISVYHFLQYSISVFSIFVFTAVHIYHASRDYIYVIIMYSTQEASGNGCSYTLYS